MMVEVNRTSGVEQTTKPTIDSVNFQYIVECLKKKEGKRPRRVEQVVRFTMGVQV
jgi:hypothetical protein